MINKENKPLQLMDFCNDRTIRYEDYLEDLNKDHLHDYLEDLIKDNPTSENDDGSKDTF